ncbi:hypothetical protein DVS28_a2090 [Euzebya pacifica]|uniref:Uncharacterized protein n=1 Tax=Euzebya pacifica TaxID=1608957 RepID=A0A346XX27_9ACTN|nr:hypothetical protein DVS28_a2090 [Euzebya pacifica]
MSRFPWRGQYGLGGRFDTAPLDPCPTDKTPNARPDGRAHGQTLRGATPRCSRSR